MLLWSLERRGAVRGRYTGWETTVDKSRQLENSLRWQRAVREEVGRRKSVLWRGCGEGLVYWRFSQDWCRVELSILEGGLPLGIREGGRECEKRVHTLDIHPETLRFIGKDAWEVMSKGMQTYTQHHKRRQLFRLSSDPQACEFLQQSSWNIMPLTTLPPFVTASVVLTLNSNIREKRCSSPFMWMLTSSHRPFFFLFVLWGCE